MDFSDRSLQLSLSPSSQVSELNEGGFRYRKRVMAAPSVYGGAGGHGTRISTFSPMVHSGNEIHTCNLFVDNEKITMQSLNDRLANYLKNVHHLEHSNSRLEVQIKQWYETNSASTRRDYSEYYQQIQELQHQVKDALLKNARCVLQIDNAKLAAEDFKIKYEIEKSMRLTVESEIQSLKKVCDELTLLKTDMEIQIEELNKDLAVLKKEHQEEVDCLKKQLGKTVNVEVDAPPGQNLGTIMNEMREKYEAMAQKYLQDAKEQFDLQIGTLQQQVTVSTEELKGTELQIKELSHHHQNLKIQFHTQLSMKESLARTLEETKARYSGQLAKIQALLKSLETQLRQIRTELECQNKEYDILHDIKTQLEHEIATYRSLLEGVDVTTTGFPLNIPEEIDRKATRKTKTDVQVIVDGKVVLSEVNETEETV
ncbi:keratin, type I cytoskeletal 20 [Dasypus novemcinctus]|uniref:keratin, type I cytoskeletal 20 n=1 Tax=Dasypus novemcinctus TaxID=9361 RepID=UPI00265FA1F8|nr:keratin, type I cytoskeletal 20 [Dasypus novemcinctus]